MRAPAYVLVTPVRDEAATIGITIEAVLAQTRLPAEWIIVSDGSTDGTNEIVERFAQQNSRICLLKVPQRAERSFAAVVENTELGIRALKASDFGFLGLLDGDVRFAPDYFERLMERFAEDARLGLAGGVVVDVGTPMRLPRNRQDVPGAVQFYRRECFESLGGLCAVPEGGWDAISCAVARMNGFRTELCVDLVVEHLKPRNASQGGPLRRKFQMGVRDYVLGYHPLFELCKCLGRLHEAPMVIAAVAWWCGYCTAAITRRSRSISSVVVDHIRSEQLLRLRVGRCLNFARVAKAIF